MAMEIMYGKSGFSTFGKRAFLRKIVMESLFILAVIIYHVFFIKYLSISFPSSSSFSSSDRPNRRSLSPIVAVFFFFLLCSPPIGSVSPLTTDRHSPPPICSVESPI
ncbi:hypothetical protein QYF36_013924 [Acer negundo]|nr:hypothetical protein QYF36_013924 [Acer negundo]